MDSRDRTWIVLWLFFSVLLPSSRPAVAIMGGNRCTPTAEDAQGPFYRPDAPLRDKLGEGYLLTGQVKSAADCRALPEAKIEIWMTGPDGRYEDKWRATTYSGADGYYRFESHFPGPYGSRPPHIHLIVNAPGYKELVTQHYPEPGTSGGTFDLVLMPIR